MIRKLANIARDLDSKGYYDLADEIDGMVAKIAQEVLTSEQAEPVQ